MVKSLFAFLVLAVVVLAPGCTGTRIKGKTDSYSQDEVLEHAKEKNTADAREFRGIDFDYRKKNFDNVLRRSKNFLNKFTRSEFLDQVHHLRALSMIAKKQFSTAIFHLKKTQQLTKNEILHIMATYNLAYVYFEMGQVDQSFSQLESIKIASLDSANRSKFYVLRAKIERIRQNYSSSADDILNAIQSQYGNTKSVDVGTQNNPMFSFLDEVLDPIVNQVVLEKLISNYSDTPASDRLFYKIATVYFNTGDRAQAKVYYERIVSDFPQSRYYSLAKESLKRIGYQNVYDARRIGVVLTLSGKFGKFGYKALQGIELALKVFQPQAENSQVSMVVMDDQGDPDRAVALMEELFYKYHVIAIIGPISSKLTDSMGKKAQELGLPLITLSQKESLSGDYVFNAGLTPAMQVRDLAEYATDTLGMKNFAILSPSSKFGEEYSRAFWDDLDTRQATVRGSENYPEDETDFRAYVDRLVGLSQHEARAHELEELRALKTEMLSKPRQNKRMDQVFELSPIVDFEAIFIPDDPKILGQVLPTFAYRDIEGVKFLGINTWNSPELLVRAGHFAEGSIFVDGFYSGSQKPSVRKFIEDYRQTFNSEPGLLEAIAFDAGHILASSLASSSASSRSDLREQIASLRSFPGISGKIFYENGRLNKQLHILTVKSGKIEEIAF